MEEEIISTLQNPQNTRYIKPFPASTYPPLLSIPPTRCGLRGQNECHLSMFVLETYPLRFSTIGRREHIHS